MLVKGLRVGGILLSVHPYLSKEARFQNDTNIFGRKVYLGELPPATSEPTLYRIFEAYGNIQEVYIKRDATATPLYAFITYESKQAASLLVRTGRKSLLIEWLSITLNLYDPSSSLPPGPRPSIPIKFRSAKEIPSSCYQHVQIECCQGAEYKAPHAYAGCRWSPKNISQLKESTARSRKRGPRVSRGTTARNIQRVEEIQGTQERPLIKFDQKSSRRISDIVRELQCHHLRNIRFN